MDLINLDKILDNNSYFIEFNLYVMVMKRKFKKLYGFIGDYTYNLFFNDLSLYDKLKRVDIVAGIDDNRVYISTPITDEVIDKVKKWKK